MMATRRGIWFSTKEYDLDGCHVIINGQRYAFALCYIDPVFMVFRGPSRAPSHNLTSSFLCAFGRDFQIL